MLSLSRITKNLLPVSYLSAHHFGFIHAKFYSAQEVYSNNIKIGNLSRVGKIQDARQVFDEMPSKDIVSWNTMITANWQNGYFTESKSLFELMPKKNIVSWNLMISGSIENGSIDDALNYFNTMPSRNTQSWNVIVSGFVKFGKIEQARKLFDEMPRRNVISYTAMISGYKHCGDIERARKLFDEMPHKNSVSWTVMISGYVDSDRFDEAEELYVRMEEKKNTVVITAMITCFSRQRKIDDARNLFDEIQLKDRVSFNAMITGYAQNGIGEESFKLYIQLQRSNFRPDESTLVSLLLASSSLASLKVGKQTHNLVIKHGFDSYISVSNALITTYSKCGEIVDAISVFRHISDPNLFTWNTIIAAFAQHGLYEKSLLIFNQMELKGIKPDGITFLSILSACAHSGMVTEIEYWFSMMQNYQITPRAEHYACLVDLLSKANEVEKAYEVIVRMPFKGDSGIWGALLAGCRGNLNEKIGVISAMKVLELDPKNSAAYVALSNIYAARGMWDKVVKMRALMKENGIKKQMAFSWIEFENKVEKFLAGDVAHPFIKEIHLVLKQIKMHMRSSDCTLVRVHQPSDSP